MITVFHADTLKPVDEAASIKTVYGDAVFSMGASSDGKWIASGDNKGYVTVYDVA